MPPAEPRKPKVSTTSLHVDRRLALSSAFAAMMATSLSCLFWVISGWPMGFWCPDDGRHVQHVLRHDGQSGSHPQGSAFLHPPLHSGSRVVSPVVPAFRAQFRNDDAGLRTFPAVVWNLSLKTGDHDQGHPVHVHHAGDPDHVRHGIRPT